MSKLRKKPKKRQKLKINMFARAPYFTGLF